MTINTKFTAEEIREIEVEIALRAYFHSRERVPETQEEFDAWCENIIEKKKEKERKEAERKAKRIERENQPGFKTKRNYKRVMTEIEKAKEEMKALERKIAYYEKKKVELAKQFKEETGEEI